MLPGSRGVEAHNLSLSIDHHQDEEIILRCFSPKVTNETGNYDNFNLNPLFLLIQILALSGTKTFPSGGKNSAFSLFVAVCSCDKTSPTMYA